MPFNYEKCPTCEQESFIENKWEFPFTEPGKGAGKQSHSYIGKARELERREILQAIQLYYNKISQDKVLEVEFPDLHGERLKAIGDITQIIKERK